MKKRFMVGIALILALSLAGLTLAQGEVKKEELAGVSKPATGKSTEAVKPAQAQGKEKAQKHTAAKPDIRRMGGLVTTVDPQAKTLSIHQETVHHDWVVNLRVSEKVAKELPNIKAGDLVNVWVNGEAITAFNKVI
jgi:hypothetical protein